MLLLNKSQTKINVMQILNINKTKNQFKIPKKILKIVEF